MLLTFNIYFQIIIRILIPTSISQSKSHLLIHHPSTPDQLGTPIIQPQTISRYLHPTLISSSNSHLPKRHPSPYPDQYTSLDSKSIIWPIPTSSNHSFILRNWFILVRVMVDSEPIPGKLGTKWEYTMDKMSVHPTWAQDQTREHEAVNTNHLIQNPSPYPTPSYWPLDSKHLLISSLDRIHFPIPIQNSWFQIIHHWTQYQSPYLFS